MFKELVEYLRTVTSGDKGHYYCVEQTSETERFLNEKSGVFIDRPRLIPVLDLSVYDFESLAKACEVYGEDVVVCVGLEKSTAHLSGFEVDKHGRRAVLNYRLSHMFTKLESAWLGPKDFRNHLKYGCADCDQTVDLLSLIDIVSTLKFATKKETEHANSDSDEELSTKFKAETTGTAKLPDTVVLRFEPYPHLLEDASVEVEVRVQVDMEKQRLKIEPIDGQITRAKAESRRFLIDRVESFIGDGVVLAGSSN